MVFAILAALSGEKEGAKNYKPRKWYNMCMKSWNEMRKAARKFREFWTLATDSEVGGYQKFWLSLLGDVLGMDDVMSRISFQSPVQLKDTTKFLDAWIP